MLSLPADKTCAIIVMQRYFTFDKDAGAGEYYGKSGGFIGCKRYCDCQDQDLLAFVPDYKINLIVPSALNEEELGRFHSTLREVLSFIKYSDNAENWKQWQIRSWGTIHLEEKKLMY